MKEIAFFTGDVSFFKKVREGWKMPELLADATDLSRTFLGETVEPLTIVARPEVNLHASEFAAFDGKTNFVQHLNAKRNDNFCTRAG